MDFDYKEAAMTAIIVALALVLMVVSVLALGN